MEYICSVLTCSCKETARIFKAGGYGDASTPGGPRSWNMDMDKHLYLTVSLPPFCFSTCRIRKYPRPGTYSPTNKLITHPNKWSVLSRNWKAEIIIQKNMLRAGFHNVAKPLFISLKEVIWGERWECISKQLPNNLTEHRNAVNCF